MKAFEEICIGCHGNYGLFIALLTRIQLKLICKKMKFTNCQSVLSWILNLTDIIWTVVCMNNNQISTKVHLMSPKYSACYSLMSTLHISKHKLCNSVGFT